MQPDWMPGCGGRNTSQEPLACLALSSALSLWLCFGSYPYGTMAAGPRASVARVLSYVFLTGVNAGFLHKLPADRDIAT